MSFPVSILDLSSIVTGSSSAQALQNTMTLARFADQRGYTRYWMAEHHNSAGIATSAPEIMIGQVAHVTEHIRVGSGGIMLPNHAPLKVAEVFKLLEALYPNRIDLGIGRAPGTDGHTAMALRRSQDLSGENFPRELAELQAFATGSFPKGHIFHTVKAYPDDVDLPPIWLLGSSGFSAQLAANEGLGFSFAHHINGDIAVDMMRLYRERFQPSETFAAPHAIFATQVILADDDETAADLALTMAFMFLSLQTGMPQAKWLNPQEVKAHPMAQRYWEQLLAIRSRAIFGSPQTVKARLDALLTQSQADELMALTMVHDQDARMHSYELLAQIFDLTPPVN